MSKFLPFLEEIYDMETEQLQELLEKINAALLLPDEVPAGFETFDKFERKAFKLKDNLELELEERKKVDDLIDFFTGLQEPPSLTNEEEFFKPSFLKGSSNPMASDQTTAFSRFTAEDEELQTRASGASG